MHASCRAVGRYRDAVRDTTPSGMWPRTRKLHGVQDGDGIDPHLGDVEPAPVGEAAMPAGLTPRRRATSGEGTMRSFATMHCCARSMRSMMSLLPLETKTESPVAARKLGALPPTVFPLSDGAPMSRPVLRRLKTAG